MDSALRPAVRRAGLGSLLRLTPFILLAAVIAILAGYFVIYLVYARALFAFPFDYDQGEGFELYDAIRLAAGQNIYLDNSVFPFYSSNYPPIYRLMVAPLIWLFGPHIWTARLVTFVCSLVIGVLILVAARRVMRVEQRNGMAHDPLTRVSLLLAPVAAALAFFAANYVYYIGPLARAHIPMVMFAFAGILCLDVGLAGGNSSEARARLRWVAAGVVLLVVAGFTKLQAVDALAAGFGFLLFRNPKLCFKALLASALVTTGIVILLNAVTQGQFWLNVVLANVNEYDIQRTWLFYGQWFRLQGALIVCSALYVGWDIVAAIRARSLRPITIWSMYFAAGAAMGMLTGKWGAGPTYLVAAIAASCVCTIGLLWRMAHWGIDKAGAQPASAVVYSTRSALFALLVAVVFFAQATLNVHLPTSGRVFGTLAQILNIPPGASVWQGYPYYDVIGDTQLGHLLDPADEQAGWELARLAREAPGPVWSEEAMITLHAGKGVVTNPTQLLNLSKSGRLDTSNMIRMIEAREFGAVIFRAQFYPHDVLVAIWDRYQWGRTVRMNGFDYLVLYPRPAEETR
ncbi:MAG: hypothetical protein ACUVR3_07105 [Candidatus Roseilinea sp.]|uniref:hypothetical protein n=1 Tax=Candidatus Roseilinea sp. TaxID=2838777 RepID=UPI00404B96AC